MKGQESMRQPVCRQYSPYWFMGNKRDRETEIMKGVNEKTTLFKVSGIILRILLSPAVPRSLRRPAPRTSLPVVGETQPTLRNSRRLERRAGDRQRQGDL